MARPLAASCPVLARVLACVLAALLAAAAGPGTAAAQQSETLRARAKAAIAAGDYATAYTSFMPLAQQNDPEAQMAIAGMFAEGRGVQADHALAVAWYKAALVNAALAAPAAGSARVPAAASAPVPAAAAAPVRAPAPAAATTQPAASAAAAAARPAPAPSGAPGVWRVDLATYRSAPEAQAQWLALRAQHGDRLGRAVGVGRPQIMRDDRAGMFVLQSAGYGTRVAAEQTCLELRQLRIACSVAP